MICYYRTIYEMTMRIDTIYKMKHWRYKTVPRCKEYKIRNIKNASQSQRRFKSAKICSVPQFSRSCVGGSTVLPFPSEFPGVLPSCIVGNKGSANENDIFLVTEALRPRENSTDLRFESRFESGNLGKVVKITDTYYQLYLRRDLYTPRHTQWYYFRVSNTRSRITYRYDHEVGCKIRMIS